MKLKKASHKEQNFLLFFYCYTSSIIQSKLKLRFTVTRVTNIATCQFLWQRLNLVSGPISVVFPYVILLCVVRVDNRKFCRLRKGREILGVLLSDVWPNMMVFRVHENGNGT